MTRAQEQTQLLEPAEVKPVTEDRDSVRRYYIKGFPDYFFVYPLLKQRALNFEVATTDRSSVLTFRPNNTFSLGLGLYVLEVNLELAFAIPLRERSIVRYGESEARDLQLNVLSKRWGVDAFYQRYSGFYLEEKSQTVHGDNPFPQRPDIGTRNFGFTGHYLFNHQKVSFRSAYNFSERQLESRGSFLLSGALYTFRAAGDSSIIGERWLERFGEQVDFSRLRYTTFSLAPGYTFNVTQNHFFLNATLMVGPAHHWVSYNLSGQDSERHDIAVNAFLATRFSIGYNGYRFFGGITFASQGSRIRFDDTTFANNNSVFKVLVGYRFRESGFLTRRVWDILPFEL